jgi:hypothetical protein
MSSPYLHKRHPQNRIHYFVLPQSLMQLNEKYLLFYSNYIHKLYYFETQLIIFGFFLCCFFFFNEPKRLHVSLFKCNIITLFLIILNIKFLLSKTQTHTKRGREDLQAVPVCSYIKECST